MQAFFVVVQHSVSHITMEQTVKSFVSILAIISASSCAHTFGQELTVNYNARSIAGAEAEVCPETQNLRESMKQDIRSLINNSVLPSLRGHGACGCGGPGWRRAAYLDMTDPTQICPPAWELITTPRRSCGRPSNAGRFSGYSAMFPTQSIQYSQVCGRIIAYQFGQPQAFAYNVPNYRDIDHYYVDGVSLTYGNPRQHIWTFACALDEYPISRFYNDKCPCTNSTEQRAISIPSFIGNDYFCETGVPPGQGYTNFVFYSDDPLWDGEGCGPTSTCCAFNNPPWFCKQLPQSTSADLEVRLCSEDYKIYEDTPVERIELYIK